MMEDEYAIYASEKKFSIWIENKTMNKGVDQVPFVR